MRPAENAKIRKRLCVLSCEVFFSVLVTVASEMYSNTYLFHERDSVNSARNIGQDLFV